MFYSFTRVLIAIGNLKWRWLRCSIIYSAITSTIRVKAVVVEKRAEVLSIPCKHRSDTERLITGENILKRRKIG